MQLISTDHRKHQIFYRSTCFSNLSIKLCNPQIMRKNKIYSSSIFPKIGIRIYPNTLLSNTRPYHSNEISQSKSYIQNSRQIQQNNTKLWQYGTYIRKNNHIHNAYAEITKGNVHPQLNVLLHHNTDSDTK